MSENQLKVVIVEENGSISILKPPKIITEEEFKKLCAKITVEEKFGGKEFGTLFVMKMANILIKEHGFKPVKVIASFPSNPVFYPPENQTVVKFN